MKLLDRYILTAFMVNYLIALAVMVGLYVVIDLFVNLDEFTKAAGGLPTLLRHIISYYGWNMFLYFSQLSGVIVLVAACFTLGRFLRTNELTAILASGTSLFRVAAPLLLAGIVLNGLWIANQEWVIPRIAHKLARKHDDVEGWRTYAAWFLRDRNNALVSASVFNPRTSLLEGLIILERDPQGRMTDIIRADSARWDPEHSAWHLTLPKHTQDLSTGGATTGDASLRTERPDEYISDLTPLEIRLRQASQWTTYLGVADISRLLQRDPKSRDLIRAKHVRLTTPFINLLLLMMGLPFFLNRERPSVILAGGRALLVCGACFAFTFFCQNSDITGIPINPALPAWLPLLLFAPLMVLLVDSTKT